MSVCLPVCLSVLSRVLPPPTADCTIKPMNLKI